jgi:hypothetical protein
MIQKAETGFFGFARPKNLPRSLLKYLSDFTPLDYDLGPSGLFFISKVFKCPVTKAVPVGEKDSWHPHPDQSRRNRICVYCGVAG